MTSLGALAVALIVALTPLGGAFNFTGVPAPILLTVGLIVLGYLSLAELTKRFTRPPR